MTKSNIVIVLVAIAVAGAVGYFGYDYGKQAGIAEAMNVRNQFFQDQQRFPGAQQQGSPTGGQRGGNSSAAALFGGVQGTVDKIDGNTLTVSVTRGQQTQQVKVNVGDQTTVETFTAAKLSDVKVGARILVGVDRPQGQQGQAQTGQGQSGQGSQGQFQIPSEVTARTITILPTSFAQQ